ncbi:MAG: glycosyltransferase family 39 protein [Kineosporiaceae bacterium]|nr:glycosyltransferase family 39 protein [Kineosporiaceae bacterium]
MSLDLRPRPRPGQSAESAADLPGEGTAGRRPDPRWARPALWLLLAATLGTYLLNLTANGWANAFYSAAVQAGSTGWEALFYGSLDGANSITVDKPPAALWVMVASVKLLGLNSLAILLPEVLMGVASVAVLHAAVKRAFGAPAGLIAGMVLALTPVAALMFRFNNPDALLTLLMVLAAWATLRAVEAGAIRWMVWAGVFIGFGFLTKTLQVMLVVPTLGLAWVIMARTTLRRRMVGAFAAVAAMVVSGGWWVAIVELVPASARPYIGGSQTNSFLELTFGYNGLGRINGEETGSVGGGNGWGTTGIGRMFNDAIGGQISWLIPSALILLVAGVVLRGRAPRTDLRRAGYLVWGGWLLVTGLTFSFMAGIFHEYYTVALAPAVAALIGMGAAEAWERRSGIAGRVVLAAATWVAGVWSFALLSRTTEYGDWLRYSVLVVSVVAAAGLLVVHRLRRVVVAGVVAAALVSGLAGSAAYTATTISTAHTGSIVTAGPRTGNGPGGLGGGPGGMGGGMPAGGPGAMQGGVQGGMQGGTTGVMPTPPNGAGPGGQPGGPIGGMGGLLNASTPSAELVTALRTDAESYTWVAAAIGSQQAAGLQLGSELPVMAIGGFNGSDPSPTLAQFQAHVAAGEIHYLVASGQGGGRGGPGSSGSASEISTWVQQNYTAVTIGSVTLYDLTQPVSAS